MVILVTGGLGYLGGRIADFLQNSGIQVRIGTSRDNAYVPEQLAKCEIVKIDLLNEKSLEAACDGVAAIIHLSAMNAQSSADDPEKALLINGLGTLKLLTAAENQGVKKFLYFSTAHVYGSPLQGKINEETLPRPTHSYSITHRLAEDYVLKADKNQLLQGAVFRLSNAIGSPIFEKVDCWMLVVNDLCKQMASQGCMEIRSSKYVKRDFIPITDVCRAVSFFINDKGETLGGEIFNIANGESITLNELTKLLSSRYKTIFGHLPEIRFQNDSNVKPDETLLISSHKIIDAGFNFELDFNQEIDDLLLSCKRWFG